MHWDWTENRLYCHVYILLYIIKTPTGLNEGDSQKTGVTGVPVHAFIGYTYIWSIPGKIGPIAPRDTHALMHCVYFIIIIITTIMISDYYYWPVLVFIMYVYLFLLLFFFNSFISPLQFPRPASDDKSKMDVAHLSRHRWFTADRAGNDLRSRRRRHCDGYGRRTPYTSTDGRPEKRPNWRVYFSKLYTRG